MDGNTVIKTRANLIKEFNEDKDIFVFLLTTKVGVCFILVLCSIYFPFLFVSI
jgi:hypothetical protein